MSLLSCEPSGTDLGGEMPAGPPLPLDLCKRDPCPRPVPSDAAYTGFALTKELSYEAETQAQSPGVHAAFSLLSMPTLMLAKMIRVCLLHNRTLTSMNCVSTLLLSAARGS